MAPPTMLPASPVMPALIPRAALAAFGAAELLDSGAELELGLDDWSVEEGALDDEGGDVVNVPADTPVAVSVVVSVVDGCVVV